MEKPRLVEDHIRKNKRDTVIICMFMVILLFSVIFAVGLLLGAPPILTMMIGLPIALFYIFITYSFSIQSVISAAHARPANPQNREEKLLIYTANGCFPRSLFQCKFFNLNNISPTKAF